jgi:hypothetical protein
MAQIDEQKRELESMAGKVFLEATVHRLKATGMSEEELMIILTNISTS